jgi:hypothetical protein
VEADCLKVPVVQTDQFILYIEDVDGYWFIHCDVLTKWNKAVKHNLKLWFKRLTDECGKELFALHTPEDKKHEKFLKIFNFSYLHSIKGNDSKNYDIYIWR